MTPATARRVRGWTVRDVMRIDVVSVVPQMTARELVHTFLDEQVRGAPVLDPDGKILGMVAETDLLRVMADAELGRSPCDLDGICVEDLMRPVETTITPGQALPELVRTFRDAHLQRVLVVEHDMLLGIVTPADVLRVVNEAA